MNRRARVVAIMVLNTAAASVVLIALVEVGLRVLLGDILPAVEENEVIGTFRAAEDIRLAPNPQFVTNAEGLWVANHHRQGVNPDGYRSPPLDEPTRGRKTLLLLGDSFTWGMSASPLSEAFPEKLRHAGYKVCNLGIPGIATVQYRAQAESLVPRVKPDAVCVFFYTGNDFDLEPPIVTGRPRNYETNIAELRALRMDGSPIPFEAATEEFAARYGTGIWSRLYRQGMATGIATVSRAWSGPTDEDRAAVALENLRAISAVAAQNGARFYLVLLPTRPELATELSASAPERLRALSPITVPGLGAGHFAPMPDAHYNNAGHTVVAEFAAEHLKQTGL